MNIDIKFVYAAIACVLLLLFIIHTRKSSYGVRNGLFNLAEFKDLPSNIKKALSNNIISISNAMKLLSKNQQQDFINEMNMGIDRMLMEITSRQTDMSAKQYDMPMSAKQYNSPMYDPNLVSVTATSNPGVYKVASKVSDKFSM